MKLAAPMAFLVLMVTVVGCKKGEKENNGDVEIDQIIDKILNEGPIVEIDLDGVAEERLTPSLVIGSDSVEASRPFAAIAETGVMLDDTLYVVDRLGHHILVIDDKGTIVRYLGRQGRAPGEFRQPTCVSANDSLVAVLDMGNGRLQIFDRNFHYLTSIPAFFWPYAGNMAASRSRLYLSDDVSAGPYLLKVLDPAKNFLEVAHYAPRLVPLGKQPMGMNTAKCAVTADDRLCFCYTCKPYLFLVERGKHYLSLALRGRAVDRAVPSSEILRNNPGKTIVTRFFEGLLYTNDGRILFTNKSTLYVLQLHGNSCSLTGRYLLEISKDYIAMSIYPVGSDVYVFEGSNKVFKFSLPRASSAL